MTKGSNLVIVESPSKAKTIGKYLGPDYRVEACMGHLRDLPKSKMGVDLEHDFEPDYQPLASKAAIISELRSASKAAKHIYLATDPDREGEATICHCRECQRPFAVQKEIDYAIALLKHNGDTRAELHRESFETCPECKRQKCLVPSDRIELTRHMREAS